MPRRAFAVDKVSPAVRSRMMSSVRGKNTEPELRVRRALHGSGLRYRLNVGSLPGTPDIVFPKYKAVVLVHGCFWHGHSCKKGTLPESNVAFWENKISRNHQRDVANVQRLGAQGWRCLTVWECSLRRADLASTVLGAVRHWVLAGSKSGEIVIVGDEVSFAPADFRRFQPSTDDRSPEP